MLFVTPGVRKERAENPRSMPKDGRRAFWRESMGSFTLGAPTSITYPVGPEGERILARARRLEAEMMAWYAAEKLKGRKRRRRPSRREPS